mgnify:CR=1 FL=1
MKMKILSLNCQRGYQKGLEKFLRQTLQEEKYKLLILQEVDAKVLPFLQHPSYKLVRAFNEETGKESELCIMYGGKYNLVKTGFKSFASMRNDPRYGFKHPGFGLLWADLTIGNLPFRVGSIHLHSGVNQKARAAELEQAKEIFLKTPCVPKVLAGDFNAGYPGESSNMANILAPEFTWKTKGTGPTLDSRYSENVPHLPNRIAALLRLFNIKIPLWTDHFFVDMESAKKYDICCRVLPNRVSDHSPIEFIMGNKLA